MSGHCFNIGTYPSEQTQDFLPIGQGLFQSQYALYYKIHLKMSSAAINKHILSFCLLGKINWAEKTDY